jgi:hypothetical protein
VRFVVLLLVLSGSAFADDGLLRASRSEIDRLEGHQSQLGRDRDRLASELRDLGAAIDLVKAQNGSGLPELLAKAKAHSDRLDGLERELAGSASSLVAARRTLIAACDRALAGELPNADRLAIARLRTAQVTALSAAEPVGRVALSADGSPLDGPRELRDKADLLRDSGDKLRREAQKLAHRIDDVERRRHLRERATAVDEDLFGDSTWSRRGAQPAGQSAPPSGGGANAAARTSDNATPNTPAPGAFAGGGTNPVTNGGGTQAVGGGNNLKDSGDALRSLVDPATLAELRRADGVDDLDTKVRALRRAQNELEGLARDLDNRAKALSRRADQLKNQK